MIPLEDVFTGIGVVLRERQTNGIPNERCLLVNAFGAGVLCGFAEKTKLLEDGGLGAEIKEMPALERVDCFARHHTHVSGFEVEGFRRWPVEANDGVE